MQDYQKMVNYLCHVVVSYLYHVIGAPGDVTNSHFVGCRMQITQCESVANFSDS